MITIKFFWNGEWRILAKDLTPEEADRVTEVAKKHFPHKVFVRV